MAAKLGQRRVSFEVPQQGAYAVQLRLTPALLETLLRAEEAGDAASIRFGDGPQSNTISVGDASFRFNALAEKSCDLLQLVSHSGSLPAIVGSVQQKLLVQRNIEDERSRVRAREEAERRKGQERKALLLDGKPVKQQKQRTVVQRVTPPPQAAAAAVRQPPRGHTPPPPAQRQQLTASMLAAPAGKPPTHPMGRGTTPPPSAGPSGKPMHKSASTGKLGGSKQTNSAGSHQLGASSAMLKMARSGASLRHCLIAMLAERSMSMNAVKAVLADMAARIRAFKVPSKDQLERALKSVAEFKAPGMYVVYPVLLKELEELGMGVASNAPPTEEQPSPSAPSEDGAAAGAAGRTKKGRAASAPAPENGGGASRKPASGNKRSRLDWTDDDNSDAEPQQPTAQRLRAHRPPAQAWQRGSTSPSSVGGGPAGASSGSGDAVAGTTGPLLRRTSSSRGSDHADDSWIEEHADRQPQPAAPIQSKEEYEQSAATFNAKYEVYFALHQLIEAHKKDFESLHAAAQSAASEEERERHLAELERLYRRRGERAKRWDAAYRVLHQELSAAKARMAEFVQQLSMAAPPPQAAAAVRVQ